MAKDLRVTIIGDTSSLERAFSRAGAASTGLGSRLGSIAKGAAIAAGAAGIGGLALVLDKSVRAALAGEQAQAALDQSLRTTHQSVTAMKPALDAAAASARKMGFTDQEAETALSRLEIATGNTKKAVQDLSVAQDIARFKHTSLTTATQMLAQAMTGSQRAAKQLGIIVSPVTANVDALKTAHVNLATAAGKAAEAHAKLQDKLATGQAVIAATTEKLHGQAAAFADTAAGGLATFSAQLDFMEQKLGNALLPKLQEVLAWVNSHWPQIQTVFQTVFQSIGTVINSTVGPAAAFILSHWQQIQAATSQAFEQVRAVVERVFNAVAPFVRATVQQIAGFVQTHWAAIQEAVTRVMSVIQAVVEHVWPVIKATITAAVKVIEDVIAVALDIINGKWGKAWNDLKKLVGDILRGVVTVIKSVLENVAGWIFTEAVALGKALMDGIGHGLAGLGESLAGSIKDKVSGAISSVKGFFGIHSPSTVTMNEIGQPLGEGVVEGWLLGTVNLPAKVSQKLQDAINAGQKVIQSAQSAFQTSWSQLASDADTAFSGIVNAIQTSAGKQLSALTSAHDDTQLQQNLSDAQAQLAQTGADPEQLQKVADATVKVQLAQSDLAAATSKYGEASVQATKATLALHGAQDTLASLQTKMSQDQVNAARAVADAEYQIQVAALQKQANAEQIQLTARNNLRQRHFDAALAQLQTHLASAHSTYAEAHAAILKLFHSFGVNYASAGVDLGAAFVQGLKESIASAASKAGVLKTQLTDVAAGIHVPKLDTGGYVERTGLAVVHRGETYSGVGSNRVGGGHTFNFYGDVTGQEIVDKVVDGINSRVRAQGAVFRTGAVKT